MGKLSVNAIKPGMVLESEVKDRNGRMLLGTGTLLNEKHLRILKIWGVEEADIKGVSGDSAAVDEAFPEDLDQDVLDRAEDFVRQRFVGSDLNYPPVRELIKFCTLRKAKEAMALDGQVLPTHRAMTTSEKASIEELKFLQLIDPADLIQEDMKLGSLPIIFHRLVDVVNDSRSSAMDIAEVIGNDPDLSARLLRVVNSAFYGLSSKIDTITRAVAIIGGNQLVSLAMGISVITYFKGIPNDLINMFSFWRHSIACGVGAKILAGHHKTPNTERFFVAGLLHDIGRLVIFKNAPDHGRRALGLARTQKKHLIDAENEVLGFGHDKMAGYLLKRWKLPVSLEKNVRFHHSVPQASNKLEAAILQVADIMTNAMELGCSGEFLVPPLGKDTWETLGLPVAVIPQSMAQMECQTDEIVQFFTQEE